MQIYQLGSDAKTVKLARDLVARIETAINDENFDEADRLIAIGANAANRPFRAEFLEMTK